MHVSRHEPPMPSLRRVPQRSAARHVHLTQDVIEQLFCDRYRLHGRRLLDPSMRFAAQETVTLIGPRGQLAHVPVIGPPVFHNQIEISPGDARWLGLPAPKRKAGGFGGTPGIIIVGPRASVRIDRGVILCRADCIPWESAPDLFSDGVV